MCSSSDPINVLMTTIRVVTGRTIEMNRYICFVGDLFAGGTLLHGEPKNLVRSTTFRNADLRIANLEHAIGTGDPITNKSTLHAPPDALDYLTELNIDAVSLANNHVHDLGCEGIEETIDLLDSVGISSFGAGRTLKEASEPFRVNNELEVLGYCAYDSPSLTKIQVATDDSPGVNPLTLEKVREDLRTIDSKTNAILFVHWGIENAWFPPTEVVQLANDLLEHPKVAGVVGTHPHRVQGYRSRGLKRAYYSIGNFLIPDYYLEPPISVTNIDPESEPVYKTKRYHPVTEITRKARTTGSRVSLLVTYDLERGRFDHTPLYQSDGEHKILELTGWQEALVQSWISFSKRLAEGPHLPNRLALKANRISYKLWNLSGILLFLYKQNGARWLLDFITLAIRSKLDPETDANARLFEFFLDTSEG